MNSKDEKINKKKCKRKEKIDQEKIDQEKIEDVKKNVIRQISNYFNSKFNYSKLKGALYFKLHLYFLGIIGFILLFTTSINILIILLIIVSLDAFSIVILHECPLTTLERKYLGFTSCDIRNESFEKAGIMYNCDHDYEKQIELLVNVWSFITAKCLSIMFFKMFNLKVLDVNNVYTSV